MKGDRGSKGETTEKAGGQGREKREEKVGSLRQRGNGFREHRSNREGGDKPWEDAWQDRERGNEQDREGQ